MPSTLGVVASGVDPVAVYDSFDRADSSTTLGTADTGQVWATVIDTGSPGTTGWGIISNTAYMPSGAFQNLAYVDSGLSDCTVEVTMVNAAGDAGVCFRVVNGSNNFVSTSNALFVRVSGSFTNLGSWGYVAGDTIKVVLSGSSIKCYTNGVEQLSVTNTNHQSATNHGMRRNGGFAVRWDDFRVKR